MSSPTHDARSTSNASQDATIRRALLLDAIYQVLDNRVFRILVVTVAILIFATFAIGFREDEVVLLFGWKHFTYEEVVESFGLPLAGGISEREGLIRLLQTLFVDKVAGSLGITFAIAATAFFVPRLLEKGLADGLFSKPISRTTFYLSCYFTGIVFVGALAVLLVVGMHAGLLVSSGYSDPGFLWGALTLTYIYAIVHGVSMLIGVLTRSSVAALLLSLLFFMGNGCVHGGWAIKQAFVDRQQRLEVHADPELEAAAEEDDDGPPQALIDGLFTTLDALHYVLPKTSDAEHITQLLRAKIMRTEPDYYDPRSSLRLQDLGAGVSIAAVQQPLPEPRMKLATKRAELATLLEIEGAGPRARLWIERAPALERGGSMSETMEKKLKAMPGIGRVSRSQQWRRQHSGRLVEWDEAIDGEARNERVLLTSGRDWVVAYALDADPEWLPPSADASAIVGLAATERAEATKEAQIEFLRGLLAATEFDEGDGGFSSDNDGNPGDALLRRNFGWDAPWKYNAWFSIGSSLAFTLLVLGIGVRRIRKIDF